MKKKTLFLMTVMAIATVSVTAKNTKDLDTLQVRTTPQMHCEGCEKRIKGNIRFVKGVKKVETSIPQQKVTIVYEPDKCNYNNLAEMFKKIGYSVERVGGR